MCKFLFLLFGILLLSCNSTPEQKVHSIARVGKSYLYKSDVANLVPSGTSKEDSLMIVRGFIQQWATQRLLIEAAERNISNQKKEAYNKLIRQYKTDLYTKGYLEELVKQSVDTMISEEQLKEYYKKNKENFRLNGKLVKLRYAYLNRTNPKFNTIKDKFFNFSKKDKKFWDIHTVHLKGFAFNDSVWVDMAQIYEKLPVITPDNREQYMVAGNRVQIQSNDDVYLIKVGSVSNKNEIAPYEYIKPTIKEIVINQRKVALIQKIEKEITDDAIKNKEYEIYK